MPLPTGPGVWGSRGRTHPEPTSPNPQLMLWFLKPLECLAQMAMSLPLGSVCADLCLGFLPSGRPLCWCGCP